MEKDSTEKLFDLLNHLSNRTDPRKLESIDTVVVTHDDEDHKNGMLVGFACRITLVTHAFS